MAKSSKQELISDVSDELSVTSELDISKEDVVAIAVSNAEDLIQEKISSLTKQIKHGEKEVKQLRSSLGESLTERTEQLLKKTAGQIVKSVERLGISAKSTYIGMSPQNDYSFTGHLTLSFQSKDDEEPTAAGIIGHAAVLRDFELTATLQMTKEQEALMDQILELTETVNNNVQEQLSWKKRAADIPRLERRYKAKLAQSQLSRSERGREIVDVLLGSIESDVLKLGNR